MKKAAQIEWDVEGDAGKELPDEMEIPGNLKDPEEISDWLTEQTGFCHKGFVLTEDKGDGEDGKGTEGKQDDAPARIEEKGF